MSRVAAYRRPPVAPELWVKSAAQEGRPRLVVAVSTMEWGGVVAMRSHTGGHGGGRAGDNVWGISWVAG
jgi:hypothetical protein